MSGMLPPPIDLHVGELINGFACLGEIARAVATGSDHESLEAWMAEFESAAITGFTSVLPNLDDDGLQILRRVMKGAVLSPADCANLTYSLIDALEFGFT